MRSGTIRDKRSVRRQFVEALFDLVRCNPNRGRQLYVGVCPRRRVTCIDESYIATIVHFLRFGRVYRFWIHKDLLLIARTFVTNHSRTSLKQCSKCGMRTFSRSSDLPAKTHLLCMPYADRLRQLLLMKASDVSEHCNAGNRVRGGTTAMAINKHLRSLMNCS